MIRRSLLHIVSFVLLSLLAGMAHADTAKEAQAVTDEAMARWNAAASERGIFAKVWDLIDSTAWDNMKRGKESVLDRKRDIDKRLKNHEDVDAELRLADLKRDAKMMDHEIAAYRDAMSSTVWKLQAGVALFIIGVFGASIWRFLKSRQRRYRPLQR
ncbi:MAG TPA: hypothetical protein VMZ53_13040 [Kofleriaceae bacterium]|nr:hypothetical protein [Kofleriaceae bacterium]